MQTIETKKERSAGGAVFKYEKGNVLYLLLHYPSSSKKKKSYWDLPKGHMEKGETEQETALREIEEETGLSEIEFIRGFRVSIHYFFQSQDARISKTVVFFLGRARRGKVKISHEHIGFQWLPIKDAVEKVKYRNAKQVLLRADDFLKTQNKKRTDIRKEKEVKKIKTKTRKS